MDLSETDLPPLYGPWVAGLLGAPPPPERHATCASCALCPGGGAGERPAGRVVLQPAVKCCTYRPALPNFLVGAVLADAAAAAGQASVRTRIGAGEATPLGVGRVQVQPPPVGSDPEHACPHLDDGGCGIWAHRHATCATFFCKHERGAAGAAAWRALRSFLLASEDALALWCCAELGFRGADLVRLVAWSGLRPELALHPAVDAAATWAGRRGEEEAFYLACHALVRPLALDDVLRIGGAPLSALADGARAAFARLDDPLPETLRIAEHRVVGLGGDGALVETYSELDPMILPALLQAVLYTFDGSPTAAILDRLAEEHALGLDPGLLRALVDFGLVVDAGAAP